MAVDPRHSNIVVVGTNTNYDAPINGTYPVAYFSSRDEGRTFAAGTVPVLQPYTTGADPTVTIDHNGTVFYSYLGETLSYCSSGSSAVLVAHSIDGGRSFRSTRVVDRSPADDKPSMAVESEPSGPSHVFVAWTRFHAHTSDIWFSRSLDGGVRISTPVRLATGRLDEEGAVPVVGAGRRIYVVWAKRPDAGNAAPGPATILVRASRDDGAHFGGSVRVATLRALPEMSNPGSMRNLTFPAAIAGTDGALYVAWPQTSRVLGKGRVMADVMISRSTDGASSWSAPHRVNDARGGDRFMPAITTMRDGTVALAFYDRRGNPSYLKVYAARVSFVRGFHVSRNVRVDAGLSPISDIPYIAPGSTCFAPGRFFGDYIGIASTGRDTARMAWTDTSSQISGDTDIRFRSIRLPPATHID